MEPFVSRMILRLTLGRVFISCTLPIFYLEKCSNLCTTENGHRDASLYSKTLVGLLFI